MSYILQALERSERERKRRETPQPEASQSFIAPERTERRSLFGPAALALSALALAVAIWGAAQNRDWFDIAREAPSMIAATPAAGDSVSAASPPLPSAGDADTHLIARPAPARSIPETDSSPDKAEDTPGRLTTELARQPAPPATGAEAPTGRIGARAPDSVTAGVNVARSQVPAAAPPGTAAARAEAAELAPPRPQTANRSAKAPAAPVPRLPVLNPPADERSAKPRNTGRAARPNARPTARTSAPATPAPVAPTTIVAAAAPAQSDTRAASTTPAQAQPFASVPTLSHLSGAFRDSLPELAINAHMYSPEPENRRVVLNMRGYGEGAKLLSGLEVVAITRRGVVMSYEGTRFLVPR